MSLKNALSKFNRDLSWKEQGVWGLIFTTTLFSGYAYHASLYKKANKENHHEQLVHELAEINAQKMTDFGQWVLNGQPAKQNAYDVMSQRISYILSQVGSQNLIHNWNHYRAHEVNLFYTKQKDLLAIADHLGRLADHQSIIFNELGYAPALRNHQIEISETINRIVDDISILAMSQVEGVKQDVKLNKRIQLLKYELVLLNNQLVALKGDLSLNAFESERYALTQNGLAFVLLGLLALVICYPVYRQQSARQSAINVFSELGIDATLEHLSMKEIADTLHQALGGEGAVQRMKLMQRVIGQVDAPFLVIDTEGTVLHQSQSLSTLLQKTGLQQAPFIGSVSEIDDEIITQQVMTLHEQNLREISFTHEIDWTPHEVTIKQLIIRGTHMGYLVQYNQKGGEQALLNEVTEALESFAFGEGEVRVDESIAVDNPLLQRINDVLDTLEYQQKEVLNCLEKIALGQQAPDITCYGPHGAALESVIQALGNRSEASFTSVAQAPLTAESPSIQLVDSAEGVEPTLVVDAIAQILATPIDCPLPVMAPQAQSVTVVKGVLGLRQFAEASLIDDSFTVSSDDVKQSPLLDSLIELIKESARQQVPEQHHFSQTIMAFLDNNEPVKSVAN